MTKQQHLSWSPIPTITTTTTTTTATTNTSSASTNNKNNQYHKNEFYIPLYRSMTDEESYADKPSPITRFVTKLLGLGTSSSNTPSNNNNNTNNKHHKQRRRPPLAHKSHSTTSITKNNSVISTPSSLQNNNNNNDTTTNNSHFNEQQQQEQEEKEKEVKESSIRVSIIEWNNDKENEDENDNDSISSTLSLLSNDTMNSSICSETCTGKKRTRKKKKDFTNNHSFTTLSSSLLYNNTTSCNCNCNNNNTTTTTTSAAVDALVSAATQIKQYEEEKRKKQQNLIGFLDNMDPPQLINRKEDTEPVLNEIISEKLRSYLPRRHRLAMKWSLLYSLDQHGASLTTLYRQCRPYRGPCILAIKDADDSIFGAFLNEPFKSNNASYYGTGECFLWKYCAKSGNIQVFPWTGKNEYMILSETEFIAIGGGDGKFGLWINSDLEHGHSEPCPTFDNECLSRKPEFACMELEIFTIPCG